MLHCAKCHRDVTAGALYCAACGAAIVPEQAPGEAADPYIGRTFKGMYFIECRVGSGGMGDVYKAVHVNLGAPVALKILKKSLLADPAVARRLHQEARAASRLRHHNVINVTDFGQTDDGTLFMAMEYVAGRSLARVIAEGFPLSEQRVVRIGGQILAALAEAHAAGILHRDLKPENVMIERWRDEPDSVKVLDFGIAKIQLAGDEGEGQPTLTQPGLVCGTPAYMSPEQCNGEDLDARSDLYSFGVLLYEMLTGKRPFDAQTPMEMARKHLTEQPIPLAQQWGGHAVSADLDALVMRALSASRDDRPASADQMRADLLACVLRPESAKNENPGTPTTTVMLPSSRTPPRRSLTPAVARHGNTPRPQSRKVRFSPAGAAVSVLVIVAIGYASLRGAGTKNPEPVLSPVPAQYADAGFAEESVPEPEPEPVREPEPVPVPVREPVREVKPKSNHCARPLHSEHGVEKISTPAAGTGDGVLVVLALPWGEVSVCGAPYGEAPVELRVRAGTYAVLVEHASGSEPQTVRVNAGSRSFVRVNFAKNR